MRAKNERRVIYGLLCYLFQAGFVPVKLDDGEEIEHMQLDGQERIKEAMELIFNLDDCKLYVKKEGFTPHYVMFVLGNADDGSEVIADWGYSEADADGFDATMRAFNEADYV
jgi:hypothetical protein